MKKIFLIFCIALSVTIQLQAQRFCVIDMEYILSNLDSYNGAQAALNKQAANWSTEIEAKFNEVERAYQKFQAEQVLMTEDMKAQKIKEIEQLEQVAKNLQKEKFGPDGALFKKRQELIKPIQDKVFQAINIYSKEKSYNVIFDKSSTGVSILYLDDKYDKSDDILKTLQ